MTQTSAKLDAQWTDDCMGKKDYDARILCIDSRFWPVGGGFILIHHDGHGNIKWQEGEDGIKPSATSSLIIRDKDDNDITLATVDFEGESFQEIAPQVEKWAQEQMDRATKALLAEFGKESS